MAAEVRDDHTISTADRRVVSFGMTSRARSARSAAMVAAGALLVHQVRYAVASPEIARPEAGHAYLASAIPVVVILVLAAVTAIVRRLAAGNGPNGRRPSTLRLWAAMSATVLAVHLAQESIEAVLAPGHVSLAASLTGAGVWAAVVAAISAGAAIALALGGERAAAELRPSLPPCARVAVVARTLAAAAVPRRLSAAAMSGCGPARAPPASSR
jgi:hypothetical protein